MTHRPLERAAIWLLLVLLLVVLCLPGLWVVLTAFRYNVEVMSKPPVWLPEALTMSNFIAIFGLSDTPGLPVAHYFRNSVIIASTSTALALGIGMMGGYACARHRFRGKTTIFLTLMLSRTVPGIALSLPIFILWSRIGLIDTNLGLIIVYVALNVPFTVWLTDGFFRQVPLELVDAARIDGCTGWQTFWLIELPLAKAGLAAAGIFAFLTSWNEYALASQLSRSTSSKTLPVGLMDFTSQFTVDWTGMSALAVLIIVPALLLTAIVQRYLIAGLTLGGLKG